MPNSLRPLILTLIALLLVALPSSAFAFEVWGFIEVDGAPLPGVADVNPLKNDGVPLSSFGFSVSRPLGTGGIPQGQTVKSAITITKAVDGISPLLFKALTDNQRVDALFRFFRPNPVNGTEEVYYEVQIANGVVGAQVMIGGVSDEMESLKLYFLTLEQTSPIAGTTHTH